MPSPSGRDLPATRVAVVSGVSSRGTRLEPEDEEDHADPAFRPASDRTAAALRAFLAGGQGALPQDSNGRPWNGDYVFSSGDLVEDLTHNFFLETGARRAAGGRGPNEKPRARTRATATKR
jgi:Mn-containing catalase